VGRLQIDGWSPGGSPPLGIQFDDLFHLFEVRWLNDKLIFLRARSRRHAATDLVFDVEGGRMIYAESVIVGALAYHQRLYLPGNSHSINLRLPQ
jgi:hypothetical protein